MRYQNHMIFFLKALTQPEIEIDPKDMDEKPKGYFRFLKARFALLPYEHPDNILGEYDTDSDEEKKETKDEELVLDRMENGNLVELTNRGAVVHPERSVVPIAEQQHRATVVVPAANRRT